MKFPTFVAAALGLSLLAPAATLAHRTNKTHYHTVNGRRVWHQAAPAVHTRIAGWRGHVARNTTATNRNLVIDFNNGHRRTVEVPSNIPLRKNGKQISVHNLKSDQNVRVWAYRIPGAEGAWRATRIIAY